MRRMGPSGVRSGSVRLRTSRQGASCALRRPLCPLRSSCLHSCAKFHPFGKASHPILVQSASDALTSANLNHPALNERTGVSSHTSVHMGTHQGSARITGDPQVTDSFRMADNPGTPVLRANRKGSSVGDSRWDEKAGPQRDALSSQAIDALEAREIEETGDEEAYHHDDAADTQQGGRTPDHRSGSGRALEPMMREIESVSERICEYDQMLDSMARNRYPEADQLKQIKGVGTLIALTYMLTLEDPHRFRKSRDAACYVGLQPGRRNSGQSEPQMHISKEGDPYLRSLLVQAAHHVLGPWGVDSDLRRWGMKLAEHGGKRGKKRAVIAVARKLAVLLHRLWMSGEVYVPLRPSNRITLPAVA
jgi:hypothetical protein